MGRPVVAFDHGGATELITNNMNGILSPLKDEKELAINISKILKLSIKKRKSLSKKSIALVKKNYLTKYMCENTLKLYKKILIEKIQ